MSVDYHPQCEYMVRISLKDTNGPFAYLFDDHPDTFQYPHVKVAKCELVEGHDGRCEVFVDGVGQPYRGHWLAWRTERRRGALADEYEWIVSAECCGASNPIGIYACNRYAGHSGGHSFVTFVA